MDMNKQFLSFEEFVTVKDYLSKKIIQSKIKYDLLVGNARGGLFLCDAISRNINVPYSISSLSFRDSKYFNGTNISFPRFDSDKRYLFIDDLIDSGKTVEVLLEYSNVDIAVIYKPKHYKSTKNIYFYKELPKNTWIDFFWETY